jgi:hypothetical protein
VGPRGGRQREPTAPSTMAPPARASQLAHAPLPCSQLLPMYPSKQLHPDRAVASQLVYVTPSPFPGRLGSKVSCPSSDMSAMVMQSPRPLQLALHATAGDEMGHAHHRDRCSGGGACTRRTQQQVRTGVVAVPPSKCTHSSDSTPYSPCPHAVPE